LNLQFGRSSFNVPNTYDQVSPPPAQDEHQNITSFNIAPGYSRIIGSQMLLTANGFARQDRVTYLPSANPFADSPATVSQERRLTNFGAKVDVAYTAGMHNVKFGGTIDATKLTEHFTLGVTVPTDPAFALPNGAFDVATFGPFDLTQAGGRPFVFNGGATIKGQAAYVQDEIQARNVTLKLGLRAEHYDGLTMSTLVQPRLGLSYAVPRSGTVLRASYGRTLETPYNENLLLSSGVGANDLVGQGQPLKPGKRNQTEVGVQQGFGRWVVVDLGYFYKHTDNGYDFNVLFGTHIVFPIAWDHSKLDGFTGRVNLVEHRGFSAFMVLAHTNAIFSPPSAGGVLVSPTTGSFRIDHDQKFNQTTSVQYAFAKPHGAWAAFVWRYDSGLVTSSIKDVTTLLGLTADQQSAIHMSCGRTVATLTSAITDCPASQIATTLLRVPAAGAGDPLNNPARVAPRHIFDLGFGVDNLFHSSRTKVKLRLSVINLTNKEALYNFLSTFSGTHFVTPRTYQAQVGVTF
jgi:hypothetical protein